MTTTCQRNGTTYVLKPAYAICQGCVAESPTSEPTKLCIELGACMTCNGTPFEGIWVEDDAVPVTAGEHSLYLWQYGRLDGFEQKLWDAFRKPIDDAFNRKSAEREKQQAAMSVHDKAVLDAAKALEAANASGDAQKIRAAMAQLERWHGAIEDFRARRFAQARAAFEGLEGEAGYSRLAEIYLAYLKDLAAAPPPPDWDASFTLYEK